MPSFDLTATEWTLVGSTPCKIELTSPTPLIYCLATALPATLDVAGSIILRPGVDMSDEALAFGQNVYARAIRGASSCLVEAAAASMPTGAPPNARSRGSRLIAFLGDSRTAMAFGANILAANGFAAWVGVLSHRRVEVRSTSNHGVSGQNTSQILARVDDVISSGAGICVFFAGTNNIALATDVGPEDIRRVLRRLRAAGIITIVVKETPRGAITSAQYGRIHAINAAYEAERLAFKGDLYMVDITRTYGDPKTGAPRLTMSSDGLHPNAYGSYTMAKPIVDIIEKLFPDPQPTFSNILDVYHATDNPWGNLLPGAVGLMDGSGGTITSLTPGGTLAANWTANGVNLPAGITVALSKVARAEGDDWQQAVFGGNYNVVNTQHIDFRPTSSVHTSAAAGDIVQAMCQYEVDAGLQNIAAIQLGLACEGSAGNTYPTDMSGTRDDVLPPVAWSGVLKTLPFQIQGTLTLLRPFLRVMPKSVAVSSPIAGTIRFGSFSVRKLS